MSVQISMRVSKEQKERLVELSKQQNKSLTQYVLDRCIIEDVDTNVDGSTPVSYTHLDVYKRQVLHTLAYV